jgi:hypothetical protein
MVFMWLVCDWRKDEWNGVARFQGRSRDVAAGSMVHRSPEFRTSRGDCASLINTTSHIVLPSFYPRRAATATVALPHHA